MGLLGRAVEKTPRKLVPIGEYVWTLWDMLLENGQYGEQIKWVWLVSTLDDPDTYLLRDDGQQEREIWQYTKTSLARGSKAWVWAEALLGRSLRIDEEPDDTDLIRRRMIAMLIHKGKRADPTDKNEAISDEIPPRAYRPAQPAARGSQPVSAQATDEEVETQLAASDALQKRLRRLIRNADLDDITALPKWGALEEIDVTNLADADLLELEKALKAAMRAAAAA